MIYPQVKLLDEFTELLKEAMELDLITEIQKEGLVAKKDKTTLTMQHRNALRALRNIQTNYIPDMKRLAKDMAKRRVVGKLLAMVETQKTFLCPSCNQGMMIDGTTSFHYKTDTHNLILVQHPAKICLSCQSESFSSESVKLSEKITQYIEKERNKLRTINPEPLETKRCPLCRSETLETGCYGFVYRYQQGLFHLELKDIPLYACCAQCGHEILDTKAYPILKDLQGALTKMSFDLLDIES